MLIFSLEDDINIDIVTDEPSDVDIQESVESTEEASDDIEETGETITQLFLVKTNLEVMHRHIQMFGITREFLHLVNKNNNFGSAINMHLGYYKEEDGELGKPEKANDNITEVDIPEEAEIEMALEGIGNAVKNLYGKIKSGVATFTTKVERFFKVCIGSVNIFKNKLAAIEKDIFGGTIDEGKFSASKAKSYTVHDFKNAINTLTKELKVSIPKFNGKETKFTFCQGSLALFGYKYEVSTKEVTYLGEKIKDIQELQISFKSDTVHELNKAKGDLQTLGWTWKEAKSLMPSVKALLEVFNTWYSNSKKINSELNKLANELAGDWDRAYTSTTYSSQGSHRSVGRVDLAGKKAEILFGNMWEEYFAVNKCLRYCFALTSDMVTNYITILNKARII